ncbi:MAG: aminotransferase class V-fold PLP-dependent enzyme [Chloroflexi bacterium]|nr:aminotransferase class V-fold PLP-dependent enzyme [Chloroflexota bacterium]
MSGRSFLQIPGPTNIPDRVLRAMDRPVIDHRSPEFAQLTEDARVGLRKVFGTAEGSPMLYPASGTGATEAAFVNVFRPGDRVLSYNYGLFSGGMGNIARKFGYEVDEVPLRWGQAVAAEDVERRLKSDTSTNPYRAVLICHNETSTGVTVDLEAVHGAMAASGHEALFVVDTVSSLASIPFRMDEWGVDVVICGSQKGLMLPPGLGILGVSRRALEVAAKGGGSPRHFWDWEPILRENRWGLFPYTPATLMLFGLREALRMLVDEEGLENVYARHRRLADAVRAAVRGWGLSAVCEDPACASNTITAVRTPEGVDSNVFLKHARERYELSLGGGIGQLSGHAFRIGHLGSLNELEVLGTLGGIELAFNDLGIEVDMGSGLLAAQRAFSQTGAPQRQPEPALAAD